MSQCRHLCFYLWDLSGLLFIAIPVHSLFNGVLPPESITVFIDDFLVFILLHPYQTIFYFIVFIVTDWLSVNFTYKNIEEWAKSNDFYIVEIKRCLLCGSQNIFFNFFLTNFQVTVKKTTEEGEEQLVATLHHGYYGGSIHDVTWMENTK